MISIVDGFYCYGCGICADLCPKGVFEMTISKEGFYIPSIVNNKCVECGICDKVCAFHNNSISVQNQVLESVSMYSNNKETRNKSTSGGVAYELSKLALEEGYKVVGVEYDYSTHRAKYCVGDDLDSLSRFQGSKYIQSQNNQVFSEILSKKNKYLVIGTPCYIDSARRAVNIKKQTDNFIFVDFFCHGVPSYLLWDKYINDRQRKYSITGINEVVFRDKHNGWGYDFTLSISGDGKKIFSKASRGDFFHSFFLNNLCLNKACYINCKYKNLASAADLRIGDLWSVKYISNKDGVSGLVAYSDKGIEFLRKLDKSCRILTEDISIVTEGQLKNKLDIPFSRANVMTDLSGDKPLLYIYWKYIIPIKCTRFIGRCFNKAKRIARIDK